MEFDKEILSDGVIAYYTKAMNHMNNQIVFYREGNRYTDDGYLFSELELYEIGINENHIIEHAKSIANWFFCQFDEQSKEFYCDEDDEITGYIKMIQVSTSVSTLIREYM